MPPKPRTKQPKKNVNAIVAVSDDFDTISSVTSSAPSVVDSTPIKKRVVRKTISKQSASVVSGAGALSGAGPGAELTTPLSVIGSSSPSVLTSQGSRSIPEWYFQLTTEYQRVYGAKVVVFMQVGQFFEIYGVRNPATNEYSGSQIEEVASLCNLNIANKNSSFDGKPMVMAGFKPMYIDRYVPRLHEAGYTIPIYVETRDNPDGSKFRELESIMSPGTAFSTDTSVVSNNVACLVLNYVAGNRWIGEKKIVSGFASVDVLSGDFIVDEFKADYVTHDPCVFDDLERVFSIYQPSELIVIYDSSVTAGGGGGAGTGASSEVSPVLSEESINDILRFMGVHSGVSVRLVDVATEGILQQKARNAEKQTYQKMAFERFFTIYDYASFEHSTGFSEYPVAATSACFLLDYVHTHNSHLTEKIQEPIMNPSSSRLRLANHSLRQLHIIEDEQSGNMNMGKMRSVLTLLNNTDTTMGRRYFRQLLLNPIIDPDVLSLRYDAIDVVMTHFDDIQKMRKQMRGMKDIERMYRRVILERITADDMFALHTTLVNIRDVIDTLAKKEYHEFRGILERLLMDGATATTTIDSQFQSKRTFVAKIICIIETALDLPVCAGVNAMRPDVNVFQRGVYTDVDDIYKKSLDTVDIVKAIATKISDITYYALNPSIGAVKSDAPISDVEYCKIHTPERTPCYLEMTRVRSNALDKYIQVKHRAGSVGSMVHVNYISRFDNREYFHNLVVSSLTFTGSGSGGGGVSSASVRVENPEIRHLCESILQYETELRRVVGMRFSQFVSQFKEYHREFLQLSRFISLLDVIMTNARNAQTYLYCRPIIVAKDSASASAVAVSGSSLNIKGIRHPIIERIQSDETYVANDVRLDPEENTILIFGTNAVGKTSLIRSIGVAVVMAQAGMYVPCSAMEYIPFKHIFTRILGNDNLFRGLSTFAVEMSELRTILRDSTEYSLVLGDELCSGTELGSAISIFIASLEHLHNRNVKSMFATHFHEITGRAEMAELSHLRMKHMSVVYSPESGALIYYRKLQDGPGSDMYGLEVCKSMRLPDWFIGRAYDLREMTPRVRMNSIPYTSACIITELDSVSMVGGSVIDNSVIVGGGGGGGSGAGSISREREPATLLSKLSKYSYKKAVHMCEMCGTREATEVHHLVPQVLADDKGVIHGGASDGSAPFHKNHPSNLMSICHPCHEKYTKENSQNKKHRRVKTTQGNIILEA